MHEQKWFRTGALAILAGLCVSCSDNSLPLEDESVLVQLNGGKITLADLAVEEARCRKAGRPVPSKTDLLDRMVEFKAQSLRARELNLDQTPSVRRQIDKILVAALREKEMPDEEVAVSDDEVRQAYDADIEKYTRPAADRFAVLFLALHKKASDQKCAEIRERMDEAWRLAKEQADNPSLTGFGKLPLTFSDDQISRYRSGDIGWSSRGLPFSRIPEKIRQVGMALKVGEISEVLEADSGLYVIKKTDFRPQAVTPFESVASSIRQRIIVERTRQQERDFVNSCVAWASPEVNEKLAALVSSKEESIASEDRGTMVPAGIPTVGK